MILPEYRNISELNLLHNNPRTIDEEDFTSLCESLKANPEFFEARPVILSDRTGILTVIAGNQRLKAAIEIGLTEVPSVLIPDLTKEKEEEIVLRDNVSNGKWDAEILKAEWSHLPLEDWGVPVDWPEDVTEIETAEEGDFDGELPTEPITVLGDLYELNGHRVHCADSTDSDAVAKLMDGKKADMVFTDPPYGYEYQSNYQDKHAMLMNDDTLLDFMPIAYMNMKEDSSIYVCASHQTAMDWRPLIDEHFIYKNLIVWKKNNWSMGDLKGAFAGQHELIFFAHKERVELRGERSRDVWEFDRDPPTDHPTQKPVELVSFAIDKVTDSKSLVLDFFLGSHSTLIACESNGRTCYGQELDPKYCDVGVRRWLKFMKDNNRPYVVKRNGIKLTEKELAGYEV